MKRCLYPKIYATLVGAVQERAPQVVMVRNGRVVCQKTPECRYVFLTDDGREIQARRTARSGSTPRVYRERFLERMRARRLLGVYDGHDWLFGARVKLYQRPRDNGEWTYRHVGE